jgi:CDP-diglyceride synthetase
MTTEDVMKDVKLYRKLFTLAAIWNWAAALLFMAMAVLNLEMIRLFLIRPPENYLWFHLFFGVVVVFGIGYYWVGQDVYGNRSIIKMGMLGKLWVFLLIAVAWRQGILTLLAAAAGTVDLGFALCFCGILRRMPTGPRASG